MPELPEVHTISSDLKGAISGFKISDAVIYGDYKVFPDRAEFKKKVVGSTILTVDRIAKNIRFHLDSGHFMLIHLAMTGQVLIRDPKHRGDKFPRILFKVTSGDKNYDVRFCDMRMFGKVAVLDHTQIEIFKKKYGPEPISDSTTPEIFYNQIRSKRTNIKNALLDQSIISGLGNIYASDALFLAGINPYTPTQEITLEMASRLLAASKNELLDGIKHRGSTLDDKMYIDAFGNMGSHQEHFKIYSKELCPTCQSKVDFSKLNGRGTYFCPVCQPLGNQRRLL